MSSRKFRKPKTTKEQFAMFVEFLEENPELFVNGAKINHADDHLQEKWEQITLQLNACSNADKTSAEYERVFANWKHSTRFKARKLMDDEKNGMKSAISLTELEKRALKIWGGSLEMVESNVGSIKAEVVGETYDVSASELNGDDTNDGSDNPLLDVDDYDQTLDDYDVDDCPTEGPINSASVEYTSAKRKRTRYAAQRDSKVLKLMNNSERSRRSAAELTARSINRLADSVLELAKSNNALAANTMRMMQMQQRTIREQFEQMHNFYKQ